MKKEKKTNKHKGSTFLSLSLRRSTNAAVLEQLKDEYVASRILPPVKIRRMGSGTH